MNSQGQVAMLRCWKCQKYIANFESLMKEQTTHLFEQPCSSATSQDTCNVWHMNVDALPDWMTCIIEKAQWTTGKLNCPFCGDRLGSFNFVNNMKCSCGQFTNIHLCKKRTDFQIISSVLSPISQLKHLSLCTVQCDFNMEMQQIMKGGTFRAKNQGHSYRVKTNDNMGRLMEALCLEAKATNIEMNSKKIHFKVSHPKTNHSVSLAVNDRYPVKAFHRKSKSLDLNFRGRLVLLPALCGTSATKKSLFSRQHESQPSNSKDCSQLMSHRTHNYFPFSLKSNTGEHTFSVTSYSVLAQEETGFNPHLAVSKNHIENSASDQQLFLSSSETERTTEEDSVEGYITSLGLFQPLKTIEQKLNKRKRNRLNSLRKKQRRQEGWLQKQTLSTEEEHEHRLDKESYLCAVCLDVYFNPYMCFPCQHIFCEPCLRTLAKDNPINTPCPLCRTAITQVFFQSELNNFTKTHFPVEYSKLKENFQESSLTKWPLPNCKKAFRVIEGFQSTDSFTRRHFPHAAHRLDYMDFEDDSRGWRFDMDMVIIYIYSINWVIGFVIFCFLCYFFFPF
uniref:E3 ubiquitin-protein ligase RNF180 n=1 Tax=Anolis carolinensis TaxID=28377 RepID=G1KRA7_ANOCA|nr:PREDICTED: E3 ubiquitin-protein ligase RNF180 isoform X1 [Anolis carolinensis]XP_008123089.1 PREDICTED: E3 ubiquitin-protein ligase RNF180 isoform X1 [Anolis carolinensis]|eukprot:XP_008123082.1 PREDICTED: E3 ubiquitin-protein ligase RNF180 isoform X1 [Anolis carolinensis]